MLKLTEEEKSMLGGAQGQIRANALQHIIDVGIFFDAKDLVAVSQAHIMADTEALGEPGVAYLESLAASPMEERRVLIPTITDPRGTDFKAYDKIKHNRSIVRLEERARDAFQALGIMMTDTCISYQTTMPPVRGEHMAFGDTGVCIYTNSVFGARTNYEGGPSALASALTGRAPKYGFHLDCNRFATRRFVVDFAPVDYVDWGALGALIGEQMDSYFDVPLIEGINTAPDSDQLKHFGAAMASYGSTALYHMAGVTPEAFDPENVLSKKDIQTNFLTRLDIEIYKKRFERSDNGLDVVVFAAPQLSLYEMQKLAALLDEKTVNSRVSLIVATNPEIKSSCDRMGFTQKIESAGGIVLEGVCFYQMHARELAQVNGWHKLMTNSVKLTNIIAGYGYDPMVASMERCVLSAIAGKVV